MTDRVQCAECRHLYDSDEHPFCPRCGALEKATDRGEAVTLAARRDPRKRPIQAAGLMMTTLGGFSFLLFVAAAIMAPSLVPETIEAVADYEGGAIVVDLDDAGRPVSGAHVQVASLNGTILANGTTNANGTWRVDGLEQAGVNVTIDTDAGTWQRLVLSLPPENGGDVTTLALDLSTAEPTSGDWVGVDSIVTVSRVLAGFFALTAVFTVIGGIAALRVRRRQWAVTGAAVGLVPSLLMAMVTLAFLVFPVLFAVAIAVFLRNRELFVD